MKPQNSKPLSVAPRYTEPITFYIIEKRFSLCTSLNESYYLLSQKDTFIHNLICNYAMGISGYADQLTLRKENYGLWEHTPDYLTFNVEFASAVCFITLDSTKLVAIGQSKVEALEALVHGSGFVGGSW